MTTRRTVIPLEAARAFRAGVSDNPAYRQEWPAEARSRAGVSMRAAPPWRAAASRRRKAGARPSPAG
jgi:hypothetical protein